MKHRRLLALALVLCANVVFAKDDPLMQIGVARIDITPDYPIRLSGYGSRRTNSEGVAQKIFAKALAFGSDREGASILFTVDNCGVPSSVTDEVAARLKKRAGIPRERVALCSSHTHSAPMLTGVLPFLFAMDIPPDQQATIDRYTRELTDKLERVALDALSNRALSKLSWMEGTVNFAKNRRVVRGTNFVFGDNDAGPVDHTFAAMLVRGADDQLRAVLGNYACHCTTLSSNRVHGDWSGCAQEAIERDNPGAIALISIGCGADANPFPRGTGTNAEAHGAEIATEVRRLLALPSKPLTKLPEGKLKRFNLDFDPLPTRAEWEERATKPGAVGYHAKKNLARLDRGEKLPTKLPYVAQTWTFDDQLAMVFLTGEVVVDYELRLKREFDSTRLWVNGYANDVPCYIPSRRILTEGGYEAEDSLRYYDRPALLAMSSEDRIINAVHDLLPKKFLAKLKVGSTGHWPVPPGDSPGGTAVMSADNSVRASNSSRLSISVGESPTGTGESPVLLKSLSPKQALKSMRVEPEFAVDLVAAEPLVVDPVAIDWGADGKLWVVEMRDYPMGIDGKWKPGGVVKFLEDKSGDGHYDKATVFLDNLPFPTGVFAWRKGVLICAAPDIIYAEDTDGDGRADVVKKIFTGFATNNFQARVNGLSLGLDNWVYGANGLLGGVIHGMSGTNEINIRGRDFRMNPDTGAFESASGLTQQSRVRDDFGNWFGCDNTHQLWHYPLADEYLRRNPHVAAPAANVQVPQGREWNRVFPASETLERFNSPESANHITSGCGVEIFRDESLGKEIYGNAFTCEPVHNLVHREVLTPDGVTFRSTRATNELDREFLASTDNWFRPVQARTGPDGALWVVDMYRFVIEHPRWIPTNRLAQLNVRVGDDKGRIYRVYRKNSPPRPIKNFAKLSTSQLADAFDSPNGTERDIIHRELLNRGDNTANEKLVELAKKSSRAAVRVQALAALNALGGVTPQLLGEMFHDAEPRVREQVLRVAEHSPNASVQIADGVTDADARVRFQAALALHGMDRADQSLAKLLPEAATNQWMRAAVLSSAAEATDELLPSAISLAESSGHAELLNALLPMATAQASSEKIDRIVIALAPTNSAQTAAWRFGALADLSGRAMSSDAGARLKQAFSLAVAAATNESSVIPLRESALRFVATQPAAFEAFNFLQSFLRVGPLQEIVVDSLVKSRNDRAPELLLSEWSNFPPSLRAKILAALASRSEWTRTMLAAVESGSISRAEIPASLRARLAADKSESVRGRVEKLWPPRTSDRAKLIDDYRKTITGGVATRGLEVFEKSCASCHALNGLGNAVGPDLATLRDKSVDDFLVAILDPNAAIEPRFLNYNIETKDGRSLSGVIRSETATSIELVAPAVHETLLRADIVKIEASSLSLMPEGLEQGITPVQMSDLIAFLKSTPTTARAAR